MCCAHLGDMGEALEAFQALLAHSPAEYGDLLLEVGDLLAANGQPQQVHFLQLRCFFMVIFNLNR